MEVLVMSRSNRSSASRLSRPLIGALGLTIVLGGSIYFHKHKPKSASAQSQVPSSIAAKPVEADHHTATLNPAPKAPVTSTNNAPAPAKTTPGVTSDTLVTQTPMPSDGNGANTGGGNSSNAQKNSPPIQIASNVPSPSSPAPLTPQPQFAAPAPIHVSAQTLVDGKSKKDAGDLVGARELINAALLSGQLSESDSDAAREMITEMSQKLVFSGKHFEGDSLTDKYQIMSGDRLSRIADRHGTTWELLCKVNELSDPKRIRAGQYIKIINGPFFAVVNKSKFRLDVYLGNAGGPGSTFVMSLPVGLGKDNSTPTGMWMVQSGNKVHPATYYSPRGEGVIAADDPRNPLGGYWMGISGLDGQAVGKTSYGIHGTIDPDSIGKQASLGCIRLRHDDIAFLYDLLVEGKSKVMVKD
jgi:lipoprotein-anchoring transpeptidase ErfK/SrfK